MRELTTGACLMSLVEDKPLSRDATEIGDVSRAIRYWEHMPPSTFRHHGRRCCKAARDWIVSMDHSQLSGHSVNTGPRWIRQRFAWGPTAWPICWCEAVKEKILDCG